MWDILVSFQSCETLSSVCWCLPNNFLEFQLGFYWFCKTSLEQLSSWHSHPSPWAPFPNCALGRLSWEPSISSCSISSFRVHHLTNYYPGVLIATVACCYIQPPMSAECRNGEKLFLRGSFVLRLRHSRSRADSFLFWLWGLLCVKVHFISEKMLFCSTFHRRTAFISIARHILLAKAFCEILGMNNGTGHLVWCLMLLWAFHFLSMKCGVNCQVLFVKQNKSHSMPSSWFSAILSCAKCFINSLWQEHMLCSVSAC